ncbi:uncharacterized protein LOC135492366 isoform X2 [Lineus longissimus]
MLLQANPSLTTKDHNDKPGMMTEYQNINLDPSIAQNSPSNANLESAKYREMCKFYSSPYNVTTKHHAPSNNTAWRHGRRINHVAHLKPLPKIVKFQDENKEELSGEYENMEAGVAVTKWSEKTFNKCLPKATSVTGYMTGSLAGRREIDEDSETIRSTPTDSTSESNTTDNLSTKSQKSKKRVQFVGIDEKRTRRTSPTTKGKKSKCQTSLLAANPYAYIKDEKTGKLPVIYEEKGVLPPIVEKYTTNVSLQHVRNACIPGNKYQSAAMRWRSVYDKIRPTNHMKTFTEVVYAVRARMNELKVTPDKDMKAEDDDSRDGRQETVKIVKTSIMQAPTTQRINANGVKMYPIDTDQCMAAECT